MQPNQPAGPMPPAPNPYDFITNPGQKPKKQLFGGGSSLAKRIILVICGAVLLMILIAIVTSLLTSGSSNNVNALKSMAAQQQEIVRIADIGSLKAQDGTVRARAVTTKLSVASQQQDLIAYLESRNIKPSKEELAAKQDKSTDTELDEASSSNRFDEAFDQELTAQLTSYATALQDAYDSTSNENGKAVLSDAFKSTAFILDLK